MLQENKTKIKLSIIIPIYNEVRYLETVINNLLNSFKNENIEYIFVNDGSSDGSAEWLNNFVSNYSKEKFKLINLSKNRGKGFALRKGLELSTGDYILFQDADLELDPKDSLEMYEIIKNDSEMKVLFANRFLSGKLQSNKNVLHAIVLMLVLFI